VAGHAVRFVAANGERQPACRGVAVIFKSYLLTRAPSEAAASEKEEEAEDQHAG
jgi:hypothetical protein